MFLHKTALGIDIHDNSAQTVLLTKRRNGIKLVAFNQIEIPNGIIKKSVVYNKERLIEVIKELLKTANPHPIKPTYLTLCSIPEMQIFTHLFQFPRRLNQEEIKKAIPFEAEKIIPFPNEQIYWDIQTTIEDEKTAQKLTHDVIYAAAPKDLTDTYYDILASCEVTPEVFALESDGLIQSLISPYDDLHGGILLIDLGSTVTTFTIYASKSIQSTNNFSINGEDLYEKIARELKVSAEEVFELHKNERLKSKHTMPAIISDLKKLVQHAKTLIEEYEKNNPHNIYKIILCGSCLDIPGIVLYLMQKLPKKVEIGNPWKKIQIDHRSFTPLAEDTPIAKTKAVAFATAIGLAMRGLEKKSLTKGINLIPEKVKQTMYQKQIKQMASLVGIIVILSMLSTMFAFAVIGGKFYFEAKKLRKEGENIAHVTSSNRYVELNKAILAFNAEVTKLENIQVQLFSPYQILENIIRHVPKKITITNIHFNHNDLSLNISGIAPKREDILEMEDNLGKSEYVSEIQSPLKNFDKKFNISFDITLKLNRQSIPLYGSK